MNLVKCHSSRLSLQTRLTWEHPTRIGPRSLVSFSEELWEIKFSQIEWTKSSIYRMQVAVKTQTYLQMNICMCLAVTLVGEAKKVLEASTATTRGHIGRGTLRVDLTLENLRFHT
jgi:hypothetical protein